MAASDTPRIAPRCVCRCRGHISVVFRDSIMHNNAARQKTFDRKKKINISLKLIFWNSAPNQRMTSINKLFVYFHFNRLNTLNKKIEKIRARKKRSKKRLCFYFFFHKATKTIVQTTRSRIIKCKQTRFWTSGNLFRNPHVTKMNSIPIARRFPLPRSRFLSNVMTGESTSNIDEPTENRPALRLFCFAVIFLQNTSSAENKRRRTLSKNAFEK